MSTDDGVREAMAEPPAHFTLGSAETTGPEHYLPTAYAKSHWGPDHLNGPAIVGLAARELELRYGAPEFLPTRLTVDLFRAARNRPTTVVSRLIRDGRRVRNAECDVQQDGVTVAQATLVLYRQSEPPPGEQWVRESDFEFPDDLHDGIDPDGVVTPRSGSDAVGWTRKLSDHQNSSRTRFTDRTVDVLHGHPNTPFVRAAMAAESTSLTTHLGSAGVGYINGDLTVGISRLPVDEWIGVQEDSHLAADGISVGTATLYDSLGAFGSGMVTAIANPGAQINFATSTFKSMRRIE